MGIEKTMFRIRISRLLMMASVSGSLMVNVVPISGVESISTVTGESARGVEEIARSTDALNRLMEDLSSLVAQFKTDDRAEWADRPASARAARPAGGNGRSRPVLTT